eukprot:UN00915
MADQKDACAAKGPMASQEGERLDCGTGIFLVLDGYARLIPNLTTYGNLFDSGASQTKVDKVTQGKGFNGDTCLLGAENQAGVYLLDLGEARPITSIKAMQRYSFAFDKVKKVPFGVIRAIPVGESITQ